MALPLVVDGVTFNYPQPGDRGNAQDATDWANAITNAIATAEADVATLQLQPYIAASSSAGTACPNGVTQIPFATVAYNYLSSFNGATGAFTAPIAGDYIIEFGVSIAVPSATAVNLFSSIYLNGAAIRDFGPDLITTNATQTSVNISGAVVVRLALNDVITVRVTNGMATSRSLNVFPTRNWVGIKKLV